MTQVQLAQILSVCGSSAFSLPVEEHALQALKLLTPSDEEGLLRVLTEHRLQLLFWDALREGGHEDVLSDSTQSWFAEVRRESLMRAARYEMALIAASNAISEKQTLIACKGAVLAQHYYPRRGLRRMHDVDFWLVDPDIDACRASLKRVGFIERPEKANSEARNFIGPQETVIDVHVQMRLFQEQGHRLSDLSRPRDGVSYRVFVPEAMVVHLVAHLLGHASQTGIFLCWLIDIALVLRSNIIDPQKIRALCRDDGSWLVFLRLVRSFTEMGWIKETWNLDSELARVRTVRWDAIARQRRRISWNGLRGKFRLGRTLLMRPDDYPPLPRPSDFLWQPLDWFTEANSITGGRGALFTPRREEG